MLLRDTAFAGLCRARDLLREEPETPSTIPAVARAVGISPFHFIRQFQALFGETPHQFRTRARLDRARRLLAADHLSVTEVCMEVGFSSLGSFSELFRRHVGASPSAYRRRLRTLVAVPAARQRALEPGCLTLMGLLPAEAFRSFREA
jgi:AraC-like DNA-binding protein